MTQTQPTQPTLALPEGQCRPGIWVHFKASKQWRTGRIIRVRRSKKGTLVAQIIVEPGETYIIAQDRLYRATPPRPVHRDWLTIPEVVTLLVDAGAIKIGINADHTDWSAGLLPGVRARWKQTPELNTWDIEEAITTYMRKCRDFPRTRATARRFYTLKFEVRDVVQRIFAEAAHKVGQGRAYLETMDERDKREQAERQPRYPARSLQAGRFQGKDPDYDDMDDDSQP